MIVVMCMPERGHVQRLLPMISGLSQREPVMVMTDARYAPEILRAGGSTFDLFQKYPLEQADSSSIPIPSRYVTFAGTYAEALIDEVATWSPPLIIYDTFAVIAPVIARRLAVPHVNVCSGHAAIPSKTLAALAVDPRVRTSHECHAAVRRLRDVYGLESASPFSYVDQLSPFLNVYGEPREFLNAQERAAFEPIAFFGSLAPDQRPLSPTRSWFSASSSRKIYVSFGTVIWRYFAPEASAALGVLSNVLGQLEAEVLISLGGYDGDPGPLERSNVRVERYVDQWEVLREADLFVTHHGLNSTHESIFHQVPMLSYPFFGDQPSMAVRCEELGLAVPLTRTARAALEPKAVHTALDHFQDPIAFRARLAEARAWELRTIAERPAVLEQILSLTRRPP